MNNGCLSLANTQPSSSSSPLRMEALLNEWLWQEEFWLPPGTRWQDFRVKDHVPLPRDLLYTVPLAFIFIALRYIFERYDSPVINCKCALYSKPPGTVFDTAAF